MINCYGCSKSIDDMYYLVAGDQFYWHFNCLKCDSCSIMLNEQSKCYLTNGKFYCTQHYFSLKSNQLSNKENMNQSPASSSCKHCRQLIKSDDYVIRLKWPSSSLYHINCFVCNDCNKKIMPGELYGTVQSTQLVYCNQHYMNQMFTTNSSSKQLETNLVDTDILLNSTNQDDLFQFSMNNSLDLNNNHKTTLSKNSKKTYKRTKSDEQEQTKSSSSTKSNSSSMKRKRYRTSFKHQQLGVLKQYFQMNPNPDSKDLTVLSKRTGLQNRVLQVWFQNARAKQRKTSTSSCSEPASSMAKNFYSSIIETDLSSLNKSVLDEAEEDEDDDEDNDLDDNDDDLSENDDEQQQNDMFSNSNNQKLCYF